MLSFVHLLTAAAIFVHATMGCCAHTAHGTNVSNYQSSDCCGCEHQGCGQEKGLVQGDHPSEQPVPHECSHTNCKWPAPEVRNCMDLVSLDVLLNSTGSLSWFANVSFALVSGNGVDSLMLLPASSLHTVPLRAHLAKCVLLI